MLSILAHRYNAVALPHLWNLARDDACQVTRLMVLVPLETAGQIESGQRAGLSL